jgi:hypothetical protein
MGEDWLSRHKCLIQCIEIFRTCRTYELVRKKSVTFLTSGSIAWLCLAPLYKKFTQLNIYIVTCAMGSLGGDK